MTRSFRHKGSRDLYLGGTGIGVRSDLRKLARRVLGVLDQAQSLHDLNYPGLGVHPLHGTPKRHAIYVNGPRRITFEWIEGDAWRVDLEQHQ